MADIQLQRKQPHTWTIIFAILIAVLIIMFLIIRHNSSPQFSKVDRPGATAVATTIPSESAILNNPEAVADNEQSTGEPSPTSPSQAPTPAQPAPISPTPAPESQPAPTPTPQSAPAPESQPAPAPAPTSPPSESAPTPAPEHINPAPTGGGPTPEPHEAPAPAPEPQSAPAPEPQNTPAPEPAPENLDKSPTGGGPAPATKPQSHPQPEPHPQHETHPRSEDNTGGGTVTEPQNNQKPAPQTQPENPNHAQHPDRAQRPAQLQNRPRYNDRGEIENRTVYIERHTETHPNHFHGYYNTAGLYYEDGFWWPFEVGAFTDFILFNYPYGYVSNQAGYPYVADGIRSLTNALYAISVQSNAAPASRDLYRQNLNDLANRLQSTPSSINAGELTSNAFLQATDWMQEISDERFPKAQNEIDQAEIAARRINRNLLLQDQQHDVSRFFDESRDAIQALKP